jgi:hypothetical protein
MDLVWEALCTQLNRDREQTLIHSALTKKIRTKKTSNGPSEADCPCGFQEQKNEVKKDMEIGAGQNGTQQPKTT